MKTFLSYGWAPVFGLYYYAVFQLVFLLRFGRFNTMVDALDVWLVVVGIVSILLCQYFTKRLERGQKKMTIPFLIALPFSLGGSLMGGLLGAVGILFFGLLPFVFALFVGYLILKRTSS